MSTLENHKNCIDIKFSSLFSVKKILISCGIIREDSLRLDEIYKSYIFKTIGILCKYSNKSEKCDEKYILNNFNLVIARENIYNKLDNILKEYNYLIRINSIKVKIKYGKNILKIKKLINRYNDVPITHSNLEKMPTICKNCFVEMKLISEENCVICVQCGGTLEADEDAIEVKIFQNTSKNLTSRHDADIHCNKWLKQIFAIDTKHIPDKVMNHIKNSIASSRIKDISSVKCSHIREYLQNKKYSNYYDYCPLIMNKINRNAPEELSEADKELIIRYVSKCISIYMSIKPKWKSKCIYYPYFIYKVIEQVFERTDAINFLKYENSLKRSISKSKKTNIIYPSKKLDILYSYMKINQKTFSARKKNILSCIHLQSKDTITRNDRIFEKICKQIPEFVYISTNKDIHSSY